MSAMPNTITTLVPGYITPKAKLDELRRQRSVRLMQRDLYGGLWRKVLIEAQRAQFKYGQVRNNNGKLQPLLAKINVYRMAVDMHATVQTGRAPAISLPEGFDVQRQAIASLSDRCLLEAMIHRVAKRTLIASEAYVMADQVDAGACLQMLRSEQVLPVGPVGPDGQPTIVERRWIIEKTVGRTTKRYLRVERHRAGLIEHELFPTTSSDVIQPLEKLKRVPLATAIDNPPADRIETGLTFPLITRFVLSFDDDTGGGEPLLPEADLDIIDAMTATLSRLHRTLQIHGSPKLRVGRGMIGQDGTVDISGDAVEDPDKVMDYIIAGFELTAQLDVMERVLDWTLLTMKMSPSLLGSGATPGTNAITAEQVRTESVATLAFGQACARYNNAAWSRTLTLASAIDTALPARGYPVAPVQVSMRPELPKDMRARIEEQSLALAAGLTDRRTALVEVHGEDAADAVLERIDEELEAKVQRDQASLFGVMSAGGAA